jgi:hypothetical protein
VTFALTSPGGWGSNAITQAGGHVAPRRVPARFSGDKARRYLAASTRRARKPRSGHACRVPRRRAFGRGFDSRRLHHPSHAPLARSGVGAVVRRASRAFGATQRARLPFHRRLAPLARAGVSAVVRRASRSAFERDPLFIAACDSPASRRFARSDPVRFRGYVQAPEDSGVAPQAGGFVGAWFMRRTRLAHVIRAKYRALRSAPGRHRVRGKD